MPRYIFNGRVLPERTGVAIAPPQTLNIMVHEAKLEFIATISIDSSQIMVIVDGESESLDIHTLRNYVESVVRLLVDAYGYLECRGYDVEIFSVVDPDGLHTVFGVEVEELKHSRVGKNPVNLSELWGLLNSGEQSKPLHSAMGNLREAVKSPADTGMFCFRAIESLRQGFVLFGDGTDTKPSWDRMSTDILVNRSFISMLEPYATAQRHGESPYMSGSDRIEAMSCTWQVVDRYVEYAQRGFQPLLDPEFDVLK